MFQLFCILKTITNPKNQRGWVTHVIRLRGTMKVFRKENHLLIHFDVSRSVQTASHCDGFCQHQEIMGSIGLSVRCQLTPLDCIYFINDLVII